MAKGHHDRLGPASRHEVVTELFELTRKKGSPVAMVDVARSSRLRRGVAHHFGSLTQARKAARISEPERPHKWNEQRVVDEILRLHRRGVRITRPSLAKAGRNDLLCAVDELGGIRVARRRARLAEPKRPSTPRTRWDDERVILEIEELHARGESLAYTKVPAALRYQGWKRFGSWSEAVAAAGVDYEQERLTPRWTDAALIAELRRLRRDHPSMGRGELGRHVIGHRVAAHFGSLDRALEAARISNWPQRTRGPSTKDAVLAALRERHKRGLSVRRGDLFVEEPRLAHAIKRFFSSFTDALVAARLAGPSARHRRWTVEQVLRLLRERRARGESMTSGSVERSDVRLFKAAKRRFGNWTKVLAALGEGARGKASRRG